MGVTRREVVEVNCDICGRDCAENDGDINIQVNGGDGRDVGPATIKATLRFNQPYGCSGGIVCVQCKHKYLAEYVAKLQLGGT